MAISDLEWEKLNAFVDGELPDEEAHAFALLIRNRADLREEQDKLLALKAGLQGLRPAPSSEQKEQRNLWASKPVHHIAASLLVVASLGIMSLFWLNWKKEEERSPFALHATFSDKTYVLPEQNPRLSVSGLSGSRFGIPDLTASALVLADVVTLSEEEPVVVAMHYRGQRGCRVTLVATGRTTASETPGSADKPGILRRQWNNEDFDFTLLATGMDIMRFKSIASYVMENTGRDANPEKTDLRIAMQESYENARPCA